ncbi:MAG: AAA family ATPase [Dehalococcoidia bacterium]|nr:AAA family ATPase [Dehalococcoidia bacterium]
MSFAADLKLRVRASYPAIYIVAREDFRCIQEVGRVAKDLGMTHQCWTATKGWNDGGTGQGDNETDPQAAIKKVMGQKDAVFSLVNFHRYLDDPEMIQIVKDLVQVGKAAGQTVCFVSNVWKVPDELTDDLARLEFDLPDRDLLEERISYVLEGAGENMAQPGKAESDRIVEAALGMTTWEAENAFSLAIIQSGSIDPELVALEKARAVAKSGVLEFYQASVSMADVGGLENLKLWLRQRKDAFTPEAKEFGLPDPKGIMLVGVPGCGKSLTAKAVSAEWKLPLLRFDLGRLFAGLVGASEENTRRAIATAEAVAPVVLWIDEIEKGMAGSSSSGSTDSGVTARVMGSLLSWMQERKRPVFVVATANQVNNLPPELMRAGRWDEIFAVDLPSAAERGQILAIHLKRRARNPEKFALARVVEATVSFSGAELEATVVKALFAAFSERREVTTKDLMEAAENTVPLAVTRKEDIDLLRAWAKTRALPASTEAPPEVISNGRTRKLRL